MTHPSDTAWPRDDRQGDAGDSDGESLDAHRGDIAAPCPSSKASAKRIEAVSAVVGSIFVAGVTTYRLGAIKDARYPGHADPAFYYNVAQNIHAGRGTTINYAWEFLSGQHPLPQYAFGYWLPLPSVLMSLALRLRDSLTAALAVNVTMSLLLAVGTYLLARGLTKSPWVPAAAAVVVTVQPAVSVFSTRPEASIYLAAFGTLALAAATWARSHPWLWLVAGGLAGLANLSRSEGLVLIIVLIVAAAAWPGTGRRVVHVTTVVAGYVVVMLPLFVESLRHFESLMPPAAGSFPFITDYEDLFSLHVDHSLSALLGGSLWKFIYLRLTTIGEQIGLSYSSLYSLDALVILLVLGSGLRSWAEALGEGRVSCVARWIRSTWFVPSAFAGATFLIYALVAPVVAGAGAVGKGMTSIAPVLVVGAMVQLSKLRLRVVAIAAIVAVLAAAPLLTLASRTRATIGGDNNVGANAARLTPLLAAEQRCVDKPVVLMARNPWELTQATGFRTVQIPNGSLDDILRVAHEYAATDIQFFSGRAALSDVAQLTSAGGPFAPTPEISGHSIYRIKAETAGALC